MQVKGIVVDAKTGETLVGATVLEKTINNVVMTDRNGKFAITVSDKMSTLEISYLGYLTKTIQAKPFLKISLESNTKELSEVVVVGYGTLRKNDLTGAISNVKSKDLGKIASVDISQVLQGKVAGVNIQMNSGEPGAGTKVRIRGVGTINNSNPLYVVDGFPVGDISHLAPNDIKSIQVLKDASATAIYGSMGSNGVILVTTKGGTISKKPEINFNAYASASQVVNKIDMLNAYEYTQVKKEAMNNAGSQISELWQNIFSLVDKNKSKGTNWQDEIFRDAIIQNYNLSIAGGTSKDKYDIGLTYANEEGIVKNTFLKKFMGHINNQYNFTKNIKLGINLFYSNYKKAGNNADYYTGPLVGALRGDPISAAWDNYTNDFGEIYFSYGTNPARSVYENKYKNTEENRFVLNSYLQFDKLFNVEGLSFRAQYGSKLVFNKVKNYYPYFYVNADQNRLQSNLYSKNANTNNWSTSDYFTYQNTLGKHSINAMAGFEAQKFDSDFNEITVYDVPEDSNMRYISASSNSTQFIANGLKYHSSLASYFVRVNYNYDNRYLLTTTLRADGSSKFINHWGYFPSFSLGWNLYEEDFMKSCSKWLDKLKLRAGWGQVGNQNAAGNNDYLALMTNGYTYVFGNMPVDGSIQQKIANKELSWETSEQYNVGIDASLWNDKLSITADAFIRNTNDMILSTPIPIYVGFWKPNTNAGSVRNKGIELALNHSNSIGEFHYNIGFNLTTINNEVTSIGGGDPIEGGNVSRVGNTTITKKGGVIGMFYGLKTDGIFHSQEEIDKYTFTDKESGKTSLIQSNAAPGDVKFIDEDGNGIIDEKDRVDLGSALPDFTYGLNISASYKNLDFAISLMGSQGNEIVNGMYFTLYSTDMSEWNVGKDMLNRWTETNPTSNIPRVNANDPNKNGRFSDRYVEDGSYMRIRNIQLGYTLPRKFTNKMNISKFRLYISCDNLYTLTNYSGYDPEVAGNNDLGAGVDIATYPIPRIITAGVNISF